MYQHKNINSGLELANNILEFPTQHECKCFFYKYNTTCLITENTSSVNSKNIEYIFDSNTKERYKWNNKNKLIIHAEQNSLKYIIENKLLDIEYDLYVSRALCYVCWNFIKYLKIKRIFYKIPYELDFTYYETKDNYKNIEIIKITNIESKHKLYDKPMSCDRTNKINVIFELKDNTKILYETFSVIGSFIELCKKYNYNSNDFKCIYSNDIINIEKIFSNIINVPIVIQM